MNQNNPAFYQRQASRHDYSVWVSASAGTGKTKVLTDRVLNLLLRNVLPQRILCLTFTKAAAAEMANRLSERLSTWSTIDDDALQTDMEKLLGHQPEQEMMSLARRLFTKFLDTPGGFHIETIHAFCQSLLGRFPLEAGIAPHFQLMDERDSRTLLTDVQQRVIGEVCLAAIKSPLPPFSKGGRFAAKESPPLEKGGRGDFIAPERESLACITSQLSETKFPELMARIITERSRVLRLFEACNNDINEVIAGLKEHLRIDPSETKDSVLALACAEGNFNRMKLRATVALLLKGGKTDIDRAERMAPWLAAASLDERIAGFESWALAFLTQKNTIRQKLMTKKLENSAPELHEALQIEAGRVLEVINKLIALEVARNSIALLRLSKAIIDRYDQEKRRRALLDYDDLILLAGRMLASEGQASWVMFKLDGGIDHVLVDEAQDTNPDQWAVIRSMTAEFFAGHGRSRSDRTVFVVGDAKQSIYSFQRADPEEYEKSRQLLSQSVLAAQGKWAEVPMNVSFRSVPTILQAVDAVFNHSAEAAGGVVKASERMEHHPYRDQVAGFVEIWPLIEPHQEELTEMWTPPVEAVRGVNTRYRLAARIAGRIAAMIASGEILPSTGQRIKAGDILILVRRRNDLVDELVRAMKRRNIPIAGADRMILVEQMAVMDLLALGNCLLLPEDDLTLATIIKGPLIGLSEESLFELAYDRQGSLWDSLQEKSGREPFRSAYQRLQEFINWVDSLSPHDFFSHVLFTPPPRYEEKPCFRSGKEALLANLGAEAEDPLDEFMALTLEYEKSHPPSLQGFLYWMETGGVNVKRDLNDDNADMVRIMTVHGSKGLEAPIVFLPDTVGQQARGQPIVWLGGKAGFSWSPDSSKFDQVSQEAREQKKLAEQNESNRLLYVAMTRARDRLYVCGAMGKKKPPENCWYNLINAAIGPLAEIVADGLRLTDHGFNRVTSALPAVAKEKPVDVPEWARKPAPVEARSGQPLYPSRLINNDIPADAMQRGRLIHRLLEILPSYSSDLYRVNAISFLNRCASGLSSEKRQEICENVIAILTNPAFAPLFGPTSRAEVPMIGQLGNHKISAQVDRLVVTDHEVLIIDYKSDIMPPDDVPVPYLAQMNAYRGLLANIFPGKKVRCALLWTSGPKIIWLDAP